MRDFGYSGLGPESESTIEGRLAEVGVSVHPPLNQADANTIVTLDATAPPPTDHNPGGHPSPPPAQPPAQASALGAPPPRTGRDPSVGSRAASDRVTHSALRAAKGAAERLAELESALDRERSEKEAALRKIEELEQAGANRGTPPARVAPIESAKTGSAETGGLVDPETVGGPTAPAAREVEVLDEARADPAGDRGRSLGPLRLSRRASSNSEPKRGPRLRKGRQITCAVCGRDAGSHSKRDVEHLGWLMMGNTALCANCVADGWRLTPRTRLPYRLTEQEREG